MVPRSARQQCGVIVVVVIIAVGALVAFQFYNSIIKFLEMPYCSVSPAYRQTGLRGECTLSYTGPADGFIARLQISAMAGAVLTAPLWLYQIWAFVTPGLRKNERKYTIIFVTLATALFLTGMALAYIVLYPALNVLISQSGSHTTAVLFIKPYLSFITTLLLIFGTAFELPLLIVMLNLVGVLSYRVLRRWQRLAIFLISSSPGVATPTADPFTMCAMAVPMVLLFEAAVLFAYFHDKRKTERSAQLDALGPPVADDVASTLNPLPERIDPADSWTSLP